MRTLGIAEVWDVATLDPTVTLPRRFEAHEQDGADARALGRPQFRSRRLRSWSMVNSYFLRQ
jgi:hypothetical protein